MALVKVLKYEGDNKTFVWKHPSEDFNTGTQLIVHESQEAIFLANGQVLDSFSAGRYTLETSNLPIISSIMKLATGGKSAFHCELYFINLTEQLAIPWGTDSKIQYLDPIYEFPIQIGACGELSLRIENAGKLLVKVVGTEKILSQEALVERLRVFVMRHVKSLMAKYIVEKKINVFELDMYLSEFSDYIHEAVAAEFLDYGINLVKFSVMTIVTPDEERNFIKFKELHYRKVNDIQEAELRKRVDIIEQEAKAEKTRIEAEALAKKRQLEGYSYQEEKSYEVAQDIAQNEAVGQMGNIGIGIGMMSGIGNSIGGKVGEITTAAIQGVNSRSTVRFCQKCGHQLSTSAKFCEVCGERVGGTICLNCGVELSEGARFCPECGMKRG